jgi:hypothetical protein
MATWQFQLQKLVRICEQLDDPLNEAFSAEPPSGKPWPSHLPSCPALQEFYGICNGGAFSHYSLASQAELEFFSEFVNEDEAEPNRYIVIGDTEFGHSLVWDSTQDQVGYYDLDGADGFVMSEEIGADLMGRTMSDFLTGLFSPPRRTRGDKVQQMWTKTLAELDRNA